MFTALCSVACSPSSGWRIILGSIAAGFGIANERKWGYYLGIAIAVFFLLPFALSLARHGTSAATSSAWPSPSPSSPSSVHPQSRQYERIWFK